MADNFGIQITRKQGSEYFKRYVRIRNKYCKKLKDLKILDKEAERFYTGRLEAPDPVTEDLVYVFDPVSVKRLLDSMTQGGFDSLVVFMGTRNEEDASRKETKGRPTLLLFPAKRGEVKQVTGYTLSDFAEEHPGSGGSGGTGITIHIDNDEVVTEIPSFLAEDYFHFI